MNMYNNKIKIKINLNKNHTNKKKKKSIMSNYLKTITREVTCNAKLLLDIEKKNNYHKQTE